MNPEGTVQPRHDRALVTLAIGRESDYWLAMAKPGFEAFCARHGCDLVILNERKIRHRLQWRKARVNLHLEKFQIGPLLDVYQRILYLDADILVSPTCPDLFSMVPEKTLGIVPDPAGPQMWKRDEEMARMQAAFGTLESPIPPYFNAGVLILSRTHRELMRFDPTRLLPGRWPDQTCLNYFSAKWTLPRTELDPRANFLPGHDGWRNAAKRRAAWIVHYAGPEAKPVMHSDAEETRNSSTDFH